MAKPIVAIVGRPNVGKSTFFNRIAGKRISIVEDTPGVTRDRIYADVEWQNRRFTLIDTGGIDPHSDDVLLSQMRRQAEIAMDTADVICFFADGRDGLTDDDREVANLLRKTKKPILLVVNKVDHISMNDNIYEFYELGLGDPIAISAANMLGLGDLLQAICEKLPPAGKDEMDETEHILQLAVVGRPNVGKSTLMNAMVGEKIAIVSSRPQTTRNRISAVVNRGDTQLILMDTPGFHKPRNRLGDYMVQVVRESVADVDGVMLVVEPIASIGEQEHALIERIRTSNAPAVLVINKIDTVEKPELLAVIAAYSEALPWRAIVPVSAQNGDGLAELFAKLDNSAVEVLEIFVVAHRAVAHHEAVIAERLNFKIVVERGDALELVPVLVVDDGAEQLARLAGRADDQALAMRDKLAFRDDRHALKVFEVRRRDELVEVLEAHLVLGDQNDVLWETVALDAERAELRHLVVDLLEARDAALFEHDEELGQHLRDRDRIVGRAVVVELRELQVVGHDVELVLAEIGQEILRENQRVEICRLERDAALFAAGHAGNAAF